MHQHDIEERMLKAEERRQKLEMEQMERMRKEDREHELRLFQMLGQMMGSGPPSNITGEDLSLEAECATQICKTCYRCLDTIAKQEDDFRRNATAFPCKRS